MKCRRTSTLHYTEFFRIGYRGPNGDAHQEPRSRSAVGISNSRVGVMIGHAASSFKEQIVEEVYRAHDDN